MPTNPDDCADTSALPYNQLTGTQEILRYISSTCYDDTWLFDEAPAERSLPQDEHTEDCHNEQET